jgi:hypothetical protein
VMTNRSYRESENPMGSKRPGARNIDWDPIRGLHQGQRPSAPRGQAVHMTAPDRDATTNFALAPQEPSTHDPTPKIIQKIDSVRKYENLAGSSFARNVTAAGG